MTNKVGPETIPTPEDKPPAYDSLGVEAGNGGVNPGSGGKRVACYVVALSITVAVVVGLVTGLTLYLLPRASDSPGGGGGGGWGPWGEWGACSVTCGAGGRRSRSRECLGEPCEGKPDQEDECNAWDCPPLEVPPWSSWSPWSACSVTCGNGTQSRSRTCPEEDESECPGDNSQDRDCPGWACPDCNATCPDVGVRDDNCTWCECPGQNLTGRVLTSHHTPLAGVRISPASAPFAPRTETGAQGSFTVTEVCVGEMLLFSKPGHVDLMYNVATVNGDRLTVILREIVPLSIRTHPESKYRLVGESVVLCCAASGDPPPHNYEWFRDGALVATSPGSELELGDLTEEQAGAYTCRANSDHSTIYSEPATLQVKASEADFCPEEPLTYLMKLPYGCKSEAGQDEYDVGRCSEAPCRMDGQNQTSNCEDDRKFCCAPTAYNRVDLVCEEGINFVFEVVSCGCVECHEEAQVVSGMLQAVDTQAPVPNATVLLHYGPSVSADASGHFVLAMPSPRKRIALTITDPGGDFVQTTQVLHALSLSGATKVTIRLHRKAEPVAFNSSQDTFLAMGTGDSDEEAFAGVNIPQGAVFTDDGEVFTGQAVARLNVVDPRNISDIESAPSDFIVVDGEGSEQMLDTFGMFNLQVEDDSGNPLHVHGDLQVSLDGGLAGDTVPNLYSLDANGKWVELGSMHAQPVTMHTAQARYFRSSVVIGNISMPVSDRWVNLDYPAPYSSCVSKVRLYKTKAYKTPISGARPYVVITRGSTNQRYSHVLNSGNGSYCIVHPCDARSVYNYNGYVLIEHKGERAFAVSDDSDNPGIKDEAVRDRISYRSVGDALYADMSLIKQQTETGPFYPHYYDTAIECQSAREDENHFRFHMEDTFVSCLEAADSKLQEFPNCGILDDTNYYTWYTKDLIPTYRAHAAIFIKILTNGNAPVVFQATSEVGNNTEGNVTVGHPYGTVYGCSQNVAAVCLEVKPSGKVSNGFCSWSPIDPPMTTDPLMTGQPDRTDWLPDETTEPRLPTGPPVTTGDFFPTTTTARPVTTEPRWSSDYVPPTTTTTQPPMTTDDFFPTTTTESPAWTTEYFPTTTTERPMTTDDFFPTTTTESPAWTTEYFTTTTTERPMTTDGFSPTTTTERPAWTTEYFTTTTTELPVTTDDFFPSTTTERPAWTTEYFTTTTTERPMTTGDFFPTTTSERPVTTEPPWATDYFTTTTTQRPLTTETPGILETTMPDGGIQETTVLLPDGPDTTFDRWETTQAPGGETLTPGKPGPPATPPPNRPTDLPGGPWFGLPVIVDDETVLRVATHGADRGKCRGYVISDALNAYVQHDTPHLVPAHAFELRLDEAFLSQLTHAQGVYVYVGGDDDDVGTVRDRAYEACMTGVDPYAYDGSKPHNADNYALKFICD